MNAQAILIEGGNFENFPRGGQLTFSRALVRAFGPALALVGYGSDDAEVGRWTRKRIAGQEIQFFAVGVPAARTAKPLIPSRLQFYTRIKRFRKEVLSLGVKNLLTLAPEAHLAARGWGWDSQCFVFSGVANPLRQSRYSWARPFADLYENLFYRTLQDVDVVMAAADQAAIADLAVRSKGRLDAASIIYKPTFVDAEVFCPREKASERTALNLEHRPIIVSCGRLNRVKGWRLVLDSFRYVREVYADAQLIFVGDGEDRPAVERQVRSMGFQAAVSVTGFLEPVMVARHLAAADVIAVGSVSEGWPTAVVEALACARPVVTTDVSGARSMVRNGVTGFVVDSRDAKDFSDALCRALTLQVSTSDSLAIRQEFGSQRVRETMSKWSALRTSNDNETVLASGEEYRT